MKATVINRYGGPEVLALTETDAPSPKRDEVLIKVGAAGVNPLDWKIRDGKMRLLVRTRFPYIPGSDLAGEVVDAGPAVKNFKPGDKVFATVGARGGAYAEYAVVPAGDAALMPKNISAIEAASLPIAGLTAWTALTTKIKIEAGDRILINGAGGGVGTLAIQIAKTFGAQVAGVCGPDSADLVKALGADQVFDYHRETFLSGGGYDHIFDTIGNLSFLSCLRALNAGGILATTVPGFLNIAASPLGFIIGRRRYKMILISPDGPRLKEIARLIEAGKIRPVIDRVYRLAEAREAQAYGAQGHAHGKIVISIP